jgi:hypothetical protein
MKYYLTVHIRRIRLTEHIAHLREVGGSYKILTGRNQLVNLVDSNIRRWALIERKREKERENVGSIHLIQGRMNIAMNLRVPLSSQEGRHSPMQLVTSSL